MGRNMPGTTATTHLNYLLEEDREEANKFGVALTPALFINEHEYQGNWDG